MKRWMWTMGIVMAALMAGCQADKQLSWDYGRAYHTVFENQKLDPKAGDDSPVEGLSGVKAASAYDRYEKAEPKKDNEDRKISTIMGFSQGK